MSSSFDHFIHKGFTPSPSKTKESEKHSKSYGRFIKSRLIPSQLVKYLIKNKKRRKSKSKKEAPPPLKIGNQPSTPSSEIPCTPASLLTMQGNGNVVLSTIPKQQQATPTSYISQLSYQIQSPPTSSSSSVRSTDGYNDNGKLVASGMGVGSAATMMVSESIAKMKNSLQSSAVSAISTIAQGIEEEVLETQGGQREHSVQPTEGNRTTNTPKTDNKVRNKNTRGTIVSVPPTSRSLHTSSSAQKPRHRITSANLTDPTTFQSLVAATRALEWLQSLRQADPRYQITKFFHDVARCGINTRKFFQEGKTDCLTSSSDLLLLPQSYSISPILRPFDRASVFSVWRPTSMDAIRKMMTGEGTGKGLDIKGKSAKRGKLSGYVPVMQIYEEEHKGMVRVPVKGGRLKVFYKKKEDRDEAMRRLKEVRKEMVEGVREALENMSEETLEEGTDVICRWVMSDPKILVLDEYSPKCYGMELPSRLFWETYVIRQDITRVFGSEDDTGRGSEPAFQDMNMESLLRKPENNSDTPNAVVFQYTDTDNPLRPQDLLMAYEEHGNVLPVVSDFDCFMVGTRGVKYEAPMPADQVDLMNWCVSHMHSILEKPITDDTWTKSWLDVLKYEKTVNNFHPNIPPFGFGDPKSYAVMERAVRRLFNNGAVRHGAECFNYYFPQELDEEFLVISDRLPGKVQWKYVDQEELRSILMTKVESGFTFPLNPKWVLCDPGWKALYDKLMASTAPNVQDSMDVWYPRDSGLRERIEEISKEYPKGYQRQRTGKSEIFVGTEAMDLAEQELKYYCMIQRAKRKLRTALLFTKHLTKVDPLKNVDPLTQSFMTLKKSLVLPDQSFNMGELEELEKEEENEAVIGVKEEEIQAMIEESEEERGDESCEERDLQDSSSSSPLHIETTPTKETTSFSSESKQDMEDEEDIDESSSLLISPLNDHNTVEDVKLLNDSKSSQDRSIVIPNDNMASEEKKEECQESGVNKQKSNEKENPQLSIKCAKSHQ